jgi:L-threonylcarbamoyladenylate synthase
MFHTIHLDASNPVDLSRAVGLLRAGRLVAFATETVYGLGANALSLTAVAGIFSAKQRPSWDPLIVHLASAEQLGSVAEVPAELAPRIAMLTKVFWPGPLTLLLPRSVAVPDAVTAGRGLVGVRVPAHPSAHALLAAVGLPIAAPSANLFGHTSPTTAAHVLADLDGRIDAVLDAGPTSIGVESTVLDPTQTPMVLYRPGAVTAAQLTAVTGVDVEVFIPDISVEREPSASMPSPGVGIRHYAPRARMVLVEGSVAALQEALRQAGDASAGVLLPDGWTLQGDAIRQCWGRWDDPKDLAATLFSGLRALDDRGVSVILCPLPEPGGLADAIRDRLQKAARSA